MTIAIILILGVLWIAVLVPPILRARGQQGRTDSVHDFKHRLTTLGQTNGTQRERPGKLPVAQPIFTPRHLGAGRTTAAQRRRRAVLFSLLGLCAFTFLVAFATRSMPFVLLQLLCDAALGGYIYLLVQYRQRTQQRAVGTPAPLYPRPATTYRQPAAIFAPGFVDHSVQSGPRLVALRQVASR